MFNLTPWHHKKLPVRHEDENPMFSLQREMNRLFEDFAGAPAGTSFGEFATGTHFFADVTPRIDMSETDKELLVKVEVPGMTEKKLK